jgi:hypothetical protein
MSLLAHAVRPVAVQFELNLAIRIRADIGGITAVRQVRVAARGDAVALRGRQAPEAVAGITGSPRVALVNIVSSLLDVTGLMVGAFGTGTFQEQNCPTSNENCPTQKLSV